MFANLMPAWLLVLAVLGTGCTSMAPTDYVLPPADNESAEEDEATYTCKVPVNEESLVEDLIERVENERDRYGLPPLVVNEALCAVADAYACRMVEGKFFAHVDPENGHDPGQRVLLADYNFIAVGENLAAGQRTAVDAVAQWMESPSHRANILGSTWRETGVAVRAGGDYGVYWVQVFADPVALPELDESVEPADADGEIDTITVSDTNVADAP